MSEIEISEKEFMAQILQLAKLMNWTCRYHTHDSRESASGFPDLVLAREEQVVFAEIKKTGNIAEMWWPEDWDRIA